MCASGARDHLCCYQQTKALPHSLSCRHLDMRTSKSVHGTFPARQMLRARHRIRLLRDGDSGEPPADPLKAATPNPPTSCRQRRQHRLRRRYCRCSVPGFCVRSFNGTVSIGGTDQTHRSADKSKTRKCIFSFPSSFLASGLVSDRCRRDSINGKGRFSAAR
jgi:hypothetical protein